MTDRHASTEGRRYAERNPVKAGLVALQFGRGAARDSAVNTVFARFFPDIQSIGDAFLAARSLVRGRLSRATAPLLNPARVQWHALTPHLPDALDAA